MTYTGPERRVPPESSLLDLLTRILHRVETLADEQREANDEREALGKRIDKLSISVDSILIEQGVAKAQRSEMQAAIKPLSLMADRATALQWVGLTLMSAIGTIGGVYAALKSYGVLTIIILVFSLAVVACDAR